MLPEHRLMNKTVSVYTFSLAPFQLQFFLVLLNQIIVWSPSLTAAFLSHTDCLETSHLKMMLHYERADEFRSI